MNNIVIIIIILLVILYAIKLHNDSTNTDRVKATKIIKKKEKVKVKPTENFNSAILKPKEKQKKDLVFMDIGINNKNIGRIVIELFSEVVPKTCQNFRVLCQKEYIGSPFHRIIKDFMIQGGDFTNGNGTGGMSIYGEKFSDENFDILHDQPYLLSMANSGKNTNGSQFFITTGEAEHLDGKHVVFGRIVDGFEIIDELNNSETGNKDNPIDNITILNSGVIK